MKKILIGLLFLSTGLSAQTFDFSCVPKIALVRQTNFLETNGWGLFVVYDAWLYDDNYLDYDFHLSRRRRVLNSNLEPTSDWGIWEHTPAFEISYRTTGGRRRKSRRFNWDPRSGVNEEFEYKLIAILGNDRIETPVDRRIKLNVIEELTFTSSADENTFVTRSGVERKRITAIGSHPEVDHVNHSTFTYLNLFLDRWHQLDGWINVANETAFGTGSYGIVTSVIVREPGRYSYRIRAGEHVLTELEVTF